MNPSVRPRVLFLCGSIRTPSRTDALVRYAADAVAGLGGTPLHWDLRRRALPIADPAYHSDPAANPDPNVRALVTAARAADAFVLASPVYHNSYAGVLKNALDLLSMTEFKGKPVALLAHGPGLSAIQACDHLRIVVRGLYGLALPEQAVTVPDDFRTRDDGEYELKNEPIQARVRQVMHAVLRLVGVLGTQP